LLWKIGVASLSYARLFKLQRKEFTDAPKLSWAKIARRLGYPQIPVYESSALGPAICLFPTGYALVLPRDLWAQASESLRVLVMRHELAHYKHNHILKMTLCRACAAIHWFNPLAKTCVARFECACEWQADDDAIEKCDVSAVCLAQSLLYFNSPRMSTSSCSGVIELANAENQLKYRVARLLSSNSEKETSMIKVLAMITTTALLVAIATSRLTVNGITFQSTSSLVAVEPRNGDANEFPNGLMVEGQVNNNAAKDAGNALQLLFDEIALAPAPRKVNVEAFRKAFPDVKRWAKEIQFDSLTSIRRTEVADSLITYEFEVDALKFFHELSYAITEDNHTSAEILQGIKNDINGPLVDLERSLKEDLKREVKLTCHFKGEFEMEYLLEVGLVNQNDFLPKFRKVMKCEPFAQPKRPDYSLVVFQKSRGDENFSDFGGFPPDPEYFEPWAAAVDKQRLFIGTVELVERAIK
jgi:hypothetical protein